jgi:hypothetical protein
MEQKMGLMQDSSKIIKDAAVDGAGKVVNQVGDGVKKGVSDEVDNKNTVRGTVALQNGQTLTCFNNMPAGMLSNGPITHSEQGKATPVAVVTAKGQLVSSNCDQLAQKKTLMPYLPPTNNAPSNSANTFIASDSPRQANETCGAWVKRKHPDHARFTNSDIHEKAFCDSDDINKQQKQYRADRAREAEAAKKETTDHMLPIVTSTKPKTKLAQTGTQPKND